jgi:hypothetical protein
MSFVTLMRERRRGVIVRRVELGLLYFGLCEGVVVLRRRIAGGYMYAYGTSGGALTW